MSTWITYGLFLLVTLGGGLLIGSQTDTGTWYQSLNKPSFTPPNWLFPVAWTILYVLVGIAGARTFLRAPTSAAMGIWVVQLLLNFAWTPVFFMAHRPSQALIVIGLLLISILAFIILRWTPDRIAAILFLPYAVWVAYATALNATIAVNN
ncbi:tryptophan-rich sensory protein [Notoacmeibacter ruber]|uniref:Tryptophan-rich sensory protein n=2 Tax=Notoacmeibacter ruber TaxID=2670375 RepID=A0A3L7JFV7_9HYPH|nr:TspO/MBR family protein [Notoacmeibacter ruber]RLQ89370.1 tryptophan-rich sensory protein [Notoacmeibacter ruber]